MALELARARIDDVCHKCSIETTLDSPQHRSGRGRTAEFDPADVVVVEAWSRVVPAVERFHLGRFEGGGACIWLLVRDADAPETLATWLIWPDAEQLRVKTIEPKSGQSRHRTLRSALQAVTSVSPGQWRSLTLLAETMLASLSGPDLIATGQLVESSTVLSAVPKKDVDGRAKPGHDDGGTGLAEGSFDRAVGITRSAGDGLPAAA